MNAQTGTKSLYKPVRRDVLQKITSLFMPARTTAAIAAAAKACERMTPEERLELASACEREYANSLSSNAVARYNALNAAKS